MAIDCREMREESLCQWTDWLGLQAVDVEVLRPKTQTELLRRLRRFGQLDRRRIRAAGSGHSTSVVAQPRAGEFLVQIEDCQLDHTHLDQGWLKHPDPLHLRVRAGTRIQDLNDRLATDGQGRALPNMGAYDGQTLAGAISTSTHGTGTITGPLCDMVKSVELVGVEADERGHPKVQAFRIEPKRGITDPVAFQADYSIHETKLIQEDEVFYSVVVGLGCFGIVTGYTLELTDAFWVEEGRSMEPWYLVRPHLHRWVEEYDFFDMVISALPEMGHHRCQVTRRRKIAPKDTPPPARNDARIEPLRKRWQRAVDEGHPNPQAKVAATMAKLANARPRFANSCTIGRLQEEAEAHPSSDRVWWSSRSDVVFLGSVGKFIHATSTEVAFDRVHAIEAVERIFAHMGMLWDRGYFHGSPIGVRFQRGSPHYLSPQYGRETCTIEAPIIPGIRRRGDETSGASTRAIALMLKRFEEELQAQPISGRPHWGQRNTQTLSEAELQYPKWNVWRRVYERFNAFGTFDSALTDALGLSMGR